MRRGAGNPDETPPGHPCIMVQVENPLPEEAETRAPYGDVALGVECAWPANIEEFSLEPWTSS